VPVSVLQHLEAAAIHLVLATRPVTLVMAYRSPTRPLIKSDLTECLSGGIRVLLAGDLIANHIDLNSRLTAARVTLLREYANRNSCLIFGPDYPTTAPYTHIATLDVLDIVIVKDFVLPVHLIVCSGLSSDHLPVLIDNTCRSSFQILMDLPDDMRMDWAAFEACLEDRLQGIPVVTHEEAIDKFVKELTNAIQEAIPASASKRRPCADPRPSIPACILDEICL
jgi:hypothetical protein